MRAAHPALYALVLLVAVLGSVALITTSRATPRFPLDGLPVGGDFSDPLRHVFVASGNHPQIAVIDAGSRDVVGKLDATLIPQQMEASGTLPRLIVSDGESPRVAIIDLTNGQTSSVPLEFTPSRLILAPDGDVAAAVNAPSGQVALIDLAHATLAQSLSAPPGFGDLLFGADGRHLYLARPDGGIAVLDRDNPGVTGHIPTDRPVARLTKSPTSRLGFARTDQGGIDVVDLKAATVAARLEGNPGITAIFPSSTGLTLIVPDEGRAKVSLLSASTLTAKAELDGAPGMGNVYVGWFDQVAFIPRTDHPGLLAYDQEKLTRLADIPLPAPPGRGTVSPDGNFVFLPLPNTGKVVVVDARTRSLAGQISLGGVPAMAVMRRTFGICH